MTGLPNSLLIAIWTVGACWAVVAVACLFGFAVRPLLPLVLIGTATGAAEWFLRRQRH